MFRRIMVPVDLAHADKLGKALSVAAALARDNKATLIYVGATSSTPSPAAHSPEEFGHKLDAFAAAQHRDHGCPTESHVIASHDPTADLGTRLIEAIAETQADAVVMASHVPGVVEHVFASRAGHVAAHAKVSVFVIR